MKGTVSRRRESLCKSLEIREAVERAEDCLVSFIPKDHGEP